MPPPTLADLWPAAGLRVRSGDLELRWADDDVLLALAETAARGIHPPDAMPFEHPWTRGTPEEVARNVLTYQWDARSRVAAGRFALELAVLADGIPVGVQGVGAEDWMVLRRVRTGSWLGAEHQGRGIGTRMRVLVLHLAFAGLEAIEAVSGAFVDNPASNAVSRRVGYELDGTVRVAREGASAAHHNYRMSRERWDALRAEHGALLGAPVELVGVEGFREIIEAIVP